VTPVAQRYALVLRETAPTLSAEAFRSLAQSVQEEPLWTALCSPAVRAEEKCAVLRRLPFLREAPAVRIFLELLAKKRRMTILPDLVPAYEALLRAEERRGLCRLRCVRVPTQAQQEALAQKLCRLHDYKSVQFDIVQEPELLGGFVLELDGKTYDNSIRGRLAQLSRQMQER
jgi:F-type H+-transporting ATPase subunit delta